MTWQPIATAPKDGRYILFTCDWGVGPRIVVGWWDSLADGWYATPCVKGLKALTPVHWMPLPDPPKAEGER